MILPLNLTRPSELLLRPKDINALHLFTSVGSTAKDLAMPFHNTLSPVFNCKGILWSVSSLSTVVHVVPLSVEYDTLVT